MRFLEGLLGLKPQAAGGNSAKSSQLNQGTANFLPCSGVAVASAIGISRLFAARACSFTTISAAAEQACGHFSEPCHSEGRELFSRILGLALEDSQSFLSSPFPSYLREVYERIQEYLFVAEINLSRPGASFEDALAQKALASMYCRADGVAQNYRKAMGWYERAAAHNDSAAIFNLGTMFQNGEGVPVDKKKAADLYLRSAHLGNSGASSMVAHLYWNGEGVEADPIEAISWMCLAAKAGFAGAADRLSWMKTQVIEAAENGDADAARALGTMFLDGRGVERDDAEAFRWFELGARLGSASAQNSLGLRYQNGQGVARDLGKALRLFIEAHNNGDADAGFNLATMHMFGLGIERDEGIAIRWLERSASRGNRNAMEALRGDPTKYLCDFVLTHLLVR